MPLAKLIAFAAALIVGPVIAGETPFKTLDDHGNVTEFLEKRTLSDGTTGVATHTLRADGSSFLLEYVFDCPARAYRYGAIRHDTQATTADVIRLKELTDRGISDNLRKPTNLPVYDEPIVELHQMYEYVCAQ